MEKIVVGTLQGYREYHMRVYVTKCKTSHLWTQSRDSVHVNHHHHYYKCKDLMEEMGKNRIGWGKHASLARGAFCFHSGLKFTEVRFLDSVDICGL